MESKKKGFLLFFLPLSFFCSCLPFPIGASLVVQVVKKPPAMKETWVQALGWDDPLEKGMATHSSILAWKSHGQRSLVG